MPADRFRAIGGFNTGFPRAAGEDRDFCDRWCRRGYGMTYASEVLVYHAHPLTLRGFWRQNFNYGLGASIFHAMRANQHHHPTREPLSFYLNLLRYPFAQNPSQRSLLLVALFGLSQCAITAGFLWERMGSGEQRHKQTV
jgi:GT2 family glycosyltransferase